jgi:hypothetical protein
MMRSIDHEIMRLNVAINRSLTISKNPQRAGTKVEPLAGD